MTLKFGGAFAALLLTTVAACGSPSAPRPTVASQPTASVAAAAPAAAIVPPAPGLLASARGPEIPANLGRPDRLVGLPPLEVTALLGEPGFSRRDGPAELWQYRGESCVLDLFLHKDGPALRVTHVEVRGRSVSRVDVDGCWRALVQTAKPKRLD